MSANGDDDIEAHKPFAISEDLMASRIHKVAGTTTLDFDGLLHPPLKLHEDLAGGCGGQLWPAGIVLAKYLLRRPQRDTLQGKVICELGAGGGLVGLALAVALSSDQERFSASAGAHLHITDQAPMLALMQQNITLNNLPAESIRATVLDWGSSIALNPPDILVAADCVYFEPAFALLLNTMTKLIGPKTICYFCFKKRRRADLRFIKEARKLFVLEDVVNDPEKNVWSREGLFLYKITANRKS